VSFTVFEVLRRYWILLSAFAIVGLVAGVVYSAASPVRYVATTQLLLKVQPAGNTTPDLVQAHNYARQLLPTLIEIANKDVVTSRVSRNVAPAGWALSAMNPANTTLINLSATTSSAKSASSLANAAAKALSEAVETDVLEEAGASVALAVVEHANAPSESTSPKWGWNIASGGVGGVILGGLLASLLAWIRQSRETRA
jgi:uncharacterized protein involved in exopolysaccharide biosynthesis